MMERRTVERKEFKGFLDFKSSTFESGTLIRQGRGVDISSQGLGMTSDYPPAQGMILRVAVPIESIGVTLPIFAEVAWVAPAQESFRSGLKFLR